MKDGTAQSIKTHFNLLLISKVYDSVRVFFFERATLIFIDQMVVNNNKILYRGLNAQSLIKPKPVSQESPIF